MKERSCSKPITEIMTSTGSLQFQSNKYLGLYIVGYYCCDVGQLCIGPNKVSQICGQCYVRVCPVILLIIF